MTIEEIISRYEHPIIGVIGATVPLPGYNPGEAKDLGYKLRNYVGKKGSLFTGGVPGVGLDVYEGIVEYCKEKGEGDKFFIMLPEGISPPEEYFNFAEMTGNARLNVERAGKDMEERRNYVAAVADALIVVNGSHGTLDEALKGICYGKEAISLSNSGGAAEVLSRLEKGEIPCPQELNADVKLIRPCNTVDEVIAYLTNNKLYKQLRGEI